MPKPAFLSTAAIHRALRIDERRPPQDGLSDRHAAAERLRRWRDETGLTDDRHLAERLAHAGLSEESFCALLVEPASKANDPHRRQDEARPAWLVHLEAAYADPPPTAAMPPGDLAQAPDAALVAPARRLLDYTWCQLLDALRARAADPAVARLGTPASLARLLARPWPLEVLRLVNRSAILELHIARFEERLRGATPAARFVSFIEEVTAPAGAARFFEQYPVLARDLSVRSSQWLAASLTLIDRLAQDADQITDRFADGAELGPVVDIEAGLSDRHHAGQTVAIVTFSSGASVVYKPRPLAVDRAFAALLDWFNRRANGTFPPLTVPAVIDRDDYGWCERVVAAASADQEAIRRYYRRQGAYVALLYALEATDFHHENVIACGEHPMLIDLETLLQPVAGSARMREGDSRPIAFNVLRSGLLPRRFSADPNAEGFDLSGLGGVDNPWIDGREPVDAGTDQMAYAPRRVPMPVYRNRPRLRADNGNNDGDGERQIFVWEHTNEVMAGFDALMQSIIDHKEALLAKDGPLAAFRGLELRYIARGTTLYVRLLVAMGHPDFQQDGLARDRLLDKLWLDAERFAHFRPLIADERAALARFDIPRFRCRTDTRDLIVEDGRRIASFFEETPFEQVCRRIARIDEDDCVRQRWLVRAAIEAIRPVDVRRSWQQQPLPTTGEAFQPERALALATRAGQELVGTAQRISRDAISWFHIGIAADNSWSLEPVRSDLYSGLPGIALFFAHLGAITGTTRFRRLAAATLETARLVQSATDFSWSNIGGMNGLGGWLYTRAHLARLWQDEQQLDGSEAEIATLQALVAEDRGFDVIAGSAGAIAGLLALNAVNHDPGALAAATVCGDHLLAYAMKRPEGGIAWPAIDGSPQPLTGFAHGTAGCAWALARLADATGEARFADAAGEAQIYERAFFAADVGAWPDLRESRRKDGTWSFFYAWCHGAPGIGLARLDSLHLLDDREAMSAEIRDAVTATLAHAFGMNHSLCHGDLGNLELIQRAAEALDEASWRHAGNELAGRILEDIATQGWRCGTGSGVVQPGLMTGLAGIGYGLLRLAAPKRVPSVLTFDLPAAAGAAA